LIPFDVIGIDRFVRVKIPGSVRKWQTLLWDTSGQVKLYNDKGQLVRTIDISQKLPELKSWKHVITVDAGKMDREEPVIKGMVKLKAGVEEIR
jgi:hypothetical protein